MKTSKFFRTILFVASFQALVFFSCTKRSEDVINTSSGDCSNTAVQKGPKFTAVESIINAKCVSCHDGGQFPNLTTACNIVNNWSLINNVCVVTKTMPTSGPLPTAEQQSITSWVDAGHKYTD
jgi:uncharacterized membrane protein